MHASIVKRYSNSKSYKPDVIPLALKVLHDRKEAVGKQQISEVANRVSSNGFSNANWNKASQCLLVSDVKKSKEYYRDQLGFTIEGQFVDRDGVSFLLKEAKNKQLIRPNHTINGYMETYIWVNHVDSVFEDLQARGAIIESEPVNQPYGMREFLVYDPDGYRFCIGGPVAYNNVQAGLAKACLNVVIRHISH